MNAHAPHESDAPLFVGHDRLVMAAFYIGRGLPFDEVAIKVGASTAQLRRVLNFFGVKGRNVGKGSRRMDIVAHQASQALIESASGLRGIEPSEIVERVVDIVFASPDLLANILDDGKPVA